MILVAKRPIIGKATDLLSARWNPSKRHSEEAYEEFRRTETQFKHPQTLLENQMAHSFTN